MIPRNGTYFDQELCLEGHYVVTGYTNDLFCNDRLQITDIRQELHRHLLEQGFEVVVFFDHNDMLYCYDQQSVDILEGREPRPAAAAPAAAAEVEDEFSAMSLDGPFGGSIAQSEAPQEAEPRPRSERFHMGRLTMANAWANVLAILKNGEHRCALVISNASSLQTSFLERELQSLQELAQPRSDNTDKNCAVIYLFRGSTMANMLNSAELGSTPWSIFFRSTLMPLIQTDDPERNRVISLRTPNAAEIRNLLLAMHMREDEALTVRVQDIPAMAEALASGCAENNWSLRRLYFRLQRYGRENPGVQLQAENCCSAADLPHRRSALEELESMIGLADIKEKIRRRYDGRTVRRSGSSIPRDASRFLPPERGGHVNATELNICLTGNPGTGKTAVASLLGRVYRETGLLPQGHLVRVSAADLVSQNVGGTTALVRDWVQQALGGVLFIDEAYMLARNAHGREAIDQLVNDMTTYGGQFAVVIAGYPGDINRLLQANDGLASRFGETWHLPDYSHEEMLRILERFINNDPDGLAISPELAAQLPVFCENWAMDHGGEWGNAREAEKLTAALKQRALARIGRAQMQRSGRLQLMPEDIPVALQHHCKPKAESAEEAIVQLESMIGLKNVKRFLRRLAQGIRVGASNTYKGRFIFYGPPGTGKTHTARLMGTLLWRLNVLKRAYVHEVTAAQLLRPDDTQDYGDRQPGYQEILEKALESARGGILFIDEAHQLADTEEGRAVLRAMVPLVENPEIRKDTCVILAGYTTEMRHLLSVDDGLSRRFPHACRIRFDNYTPAELTAILEGFATERREVLTQEYKDRTRLAMSKYLENPDANFGNAGFMRDTFLEQSIQARTRRLSLTYGGDADAVLTEEQARAIGEEEKRTLTGADLPEDFARLGGPIGLPVPPELSVWERVEQLVGKPQLREYLLSRRESEKQPVFYDAHAVVGMNFALAGNTGTGRHTAARIIAAVLKEQGLLDRDEVHFVSKGDLEAGYVGQTALKAAGVVDRARGACLVVEYPSSMLVRNANDNSFGPEALGVIAGAMNSTTEQMAVILLDTEDGLKETFRQMPALRSKMSQIFTLEDLSPADMETLFRQKTANAMHFDPQLDELLPDFFLNWVSDRGGLGESVRAWGNGTEVDMLIEDLIASWKKGGEVYKDNGVDKRHITGEMFPKSLQKYLQLTRDAAGTAMEKLERMVGLRKVKETVVALDRRIRLLGKGKVAPGFYAFLGAPGTGKTTVARRLGGVLRAAEVLEQGHVIERTAQQLADNPHSLDELLKLAKHGILFIDEAPQLLRSGGGQMVINRLLTVLTNPEITDCTCIILAGYPMEMLQLLRYDPGLESRFGKEDSMLYFEDYTAEELLEILKEKASCAHELPEIRAAAPLTLDAEYLKQSLRVFREVKAEKRSNFGNARFVVNYLYDSYKQLLIRLDPAVTGKTPTEEELTYLTELDIPEKWQRRLDEEIIPAVLYSRQLELKEGGVINEGNYASRKDTLIRSTVLIESYANGQKLGEGSGIILTQDGYILTCAHVIADGDSFRAKITCPGNVGGDFFWKNCTLLRPVQKDCDMAVLKMEGSNYTATPIRRWDKPIEDWETTLLVGYPLGGLLNGGDADNLNASCYEGRISSKQTVSRNNLCRYYIDSTGLHGNSGSPVISEEDGTLIGVFTGSVSPDKTSRDEANLFYPISYFWERFVADVPRKEITGI